MVAETPRGAKASATCYSLIETAKANGLEPYAYLRHVLEQIGAADTGWRKRADSWALTLFPGLAGGSGRPGTLLPALPVPHNFYPVPAQRY